jgi:hypothetical protein
MPATPGGRKAPSAAWAPETGGVTLLTGHFVGRADELGSLERILDELDRGCPARSRWRANRGSARRGC